MNDYDMLLLKLLKANDVTYSHGYVLTSEEK